jgi:hypothetical protein
MIEGPSAFMLPVREQPQVAQVIRTKVGREIADGPQAIET